MRVLVTGASGFAGSHLAEHITAHHQDVVLYGTFRHRGRLENLDDLARAGKVDVLAALPSSTDLARGRLALLECDLTDAGAVDRLVAAIRPDRVYHLAAQSSVPSSFAAPAATLATNVLGELNLLEALRARAPRARVLVAGSSEEYGLVRPDEVPIKETSELRPLSPYAVSKVAQDRLAFQYHRSYGLHVVVTRAFNHTGPRRGAVFATSNFARQIALAERSGGTGVVRVGDLSPERDWHDVRDTVRAYWDALEKGAPGEAYNVGSGRTRTVRDMLGLLVGLSHARIEVREDPARFRPSDVPLLCADVSKLRQATGWQPTISFERTLQDLLDWWRARVEKEVGVWT